MTDNHNQIVLAPGSEEWERWREHATVTIPGKRSALWFLVAEVLGLKNLIPMTASAHYGMCLFAERATGIPEIDEARVHLIQVARGFGKSAIVTGGLPILRLLREPNYACGIGNETQGMADRFLAQIKLQFEQNDLFRGLFPEIIPGNFHETMWSAEKIVTNRTRPRPDPSVMSMGVGTTKTGTHMDEWIIDDLLSRKQAENALRGLFTEIEATNRWVTQLPPLLSSPERDPLTFIGTPWYEGDSYEFIIRYFGNIPKEVTDLPRFLAEHALHRIWQLTLPDGTIQHIQLMRIGDIAIFKRPALENGRSIFPERWTTEELHIMAARPENAAFFAANYLLEPTAGHASEFADEWIREYDLQYSTVDPQNFNVMTRDNDGRPEYHPKSAFNFIISVDPAFSKKRSNARTAIPVVGILDQEVYLFEDFASHGMGTYDIAHKVIDFYLVYKPSKIFVETIAGQKALIEPMQRTAMERLGHKLPIEEIPMQAKSKDFRIYGLQDYFKTGRFHALRAGHLMFRTEYRQFPRGALRDILDAITFQMDEWERLFDLDRRQDRGKFREFHDKQIAKLRASATRRRG
jgi:hypothetical protein